MGESEADWLFPKKEEQRAKVEESGLLFAQRYLVFFGPTADPRARELLEHWTAQARNARIPRTATLGEYAAANAFREFVEGLHQQIAFAMHGANQPKSRTAT